MSGHYTERWNLDVFFAGGSGSPAFDQFLTGIEAGTARLLADLPDLPDPDAADAIAATASEAAWNSALAAVQKLGAEIREANSFVTCLTAQDMNDERARRLESRLSQLHAGLDAALTKLDQRLLDLSTPAWQSLLKFPAAAEIGFALTERKRLAADRLPPDQEALAGALAANGYHAWGEHYHSIAGRLTVPGEAAHSGTPESEDSKTRLSMGQAQNKLSSPDRHTRAAVFAELEKAWASEAELCAECLNHLAGFRINLYRRRGWDEVLKEPLAMNRMSAQTLETMWAVITAGKDPLAAYLGRQADNLGRAKLDWFDLNAPPAGSHSSITYPEAVDFIVEQFGHFNPELAAFADRAARQAWIEAEDRSSKRSGGFCAAFPVSHESRIFLTFGGTQGNVATLAHELGHAYHQHVMDELPQMIQRYPSSMAETASTFAELVVANAAIEHAQNEQQRAALLDDQLRRAVSQLMNIHARFLFENRFYAARREGPLSVADLNRLTLEAQREAFNNQLGQYHPYFWASTLHFYITRIPFYNFPYTFGYLFSNALYRRAVDEGPAFARRYDLLLRDTGRMTVEELAHRHLGEDLTRPEFWQGAVAAALSHSDEFLRLT